MSLLQYLFITYLYDIDDLEGIVNVVHPVINGIQRIDCVKIRNYLKIVSKYSDKDFIMLFRLSRSVAKDLICRFESTHFTTIWKV